MIEIYNKDNFDFESNGDITLEPISCVYKTELNGVKGITLEHSLDDIGRWKYAKEDSLIAVSRNEKKQFYRIYNTIKSLDSITAYARPLFYDLIDTILLDVRPTNKTAQEVLNIILQNTKFKGHSNISKVNTAYYIRKNILESITSDDENSFFNRWGGEIYLDNYDIYINDRIGVDNGVRVEFGYNLNAIEEDINLDTVATRIIPTGFDGIMLDGPTPWVDSPLINKYVNIKCRVINFDDVKVKENPEDEEGFNTIEEARQELRNRCLKLYEGGIDKPTINYKIDMVDLRETTVYKNYKSLEEVDEGDTVTCKVDTLDIDVQARCISLERDELTGELISLELGNAISNYFNQQSDITNRVSEILNPNGTVKAQSLEGTINALQTKFKAMKDIAQRQHIRANLYEDRDTTSPTFGCTCLGTMGFEIADSFKPGTQEWDFRTFGTGKGFVADCIVSGVLRTILIQNMDKSFEVDLSKPGGATFRNNGKDAITIANNQIKLYNWAKDGDYIGSLGPLILNDDPKKPIISIYNDTDSALTLGYSAENGTTVPSYVTFDKYNILGGSGEYPIKVHEKALFNSGITSADVKVATISSFKGDVILRASPYVGEEGNAIIPNSLEVSKNLVVKGSKNCIQPTTNYGNRLFYATEDCESLLTDTGNGLTQLRENGFYEDTILLDNIYKESVELSNYYIFLTKYGKGDIWVKEQTENYFVVESEYPIKFNWKVEATRKGYENIRLQEYIKIESD